MRRSSVLLFGPLDFAVLANAVRAVIALIAVAAFVRFLSLTQTETNQMSIPISFIPTFSGLLSICHGGSRVFAPDTNRPTVFVVSSSPLRVSAAQLLWRELRARLATGTRNFSLEVGNFPHGQAGPDVAIFYRWASVGYYGYQSNLNSSVPQAPSTYETYASELGNVTGEAAQLFSDFRASAAADVALDPTLAGIAAERGRFYGVIP